MARDQNSVVRFRFNHGFLETGAGSLVVKVAVSAGLCDANVMPNSLNWAVNGQDT